MSLYLSQGPLDSDMVGNLLSPESHPKGYADEVKVQSSGQVQLLSLSPETTLEGPSLLVSR